MDNIKDDRFFILRALQEIETIFKYFDNKEYEEFIKD